jgi:hypothetical protein
MLGPVKMFRLLQRSLLALVFLPGVVQAGPTWPFFGWTISASSGDPFVHTSAPVVGTDSLYLWIACTVDTTDLLRDRVNSAEFNLGGTLDGIDGIPIGVNGALWLRKEPDRLLMAIGGCPAGPLLVGILPVVDDGSGGTVCFEPSGWDLNVTVDCSTHIGEVRENDYVGFANDGSEPCRSTPTFCPVPVPVDVDTWSEVKARYR